MSHVEQDLLTLPEHLISPPIFGGVRVVYSLVVYVVSCVLLFVCLAFLFLAMVLSVCEFDCPSSIFRPSLMEDRFYKWRRIFSYWSYNNPIVFFTNVSYQIILFTVCGYMSNMTSVTCEARIFPVRVALSFYV